MGGNLMIFDKDYSTTEEGRSSARSKVLAAKHATLAIWRARVPKRNLLFFLRGGEAGYAIGCIINILRFKLNYYILKTTY